MELKELRNKLEQQKGKRMELESTIQNLRTKIRTDRILLENLEKAREIIRIVGFETQSKLKFHISDITSLALEGIFNEPYKLILDFVERRNKMECDILFERNGEQFKPLDAAGGGVVDVAAFALRIACWSMQQPRTCRVIILDEPLRFLSAEYQENASEMIKEISQRLGVQFIIVTHSDVLASSADKVFRTTIKKGVTSIKNE